MRISDWSSDVCSSDLWQHALVVRKLAIDQLRGERELTRGGADMVLTQHDADNAVRLGQQACQLQDTFARYDDLVAVRLTDIGLHRAHGQTVTVGGDGADDTGGQFQEHAVEVVTHVMLRHGRTEERREGTGGERKGR